MIEESIAHHHTLQNLLPVGEETLEWYEVQYVADKVKFTCFACENVSYHDAASSPIRGGIQKLLEHPTP
jgi:hypothetical protein